MTDNSLKLALAIQSKRAPVSPPIKEEEEYQAFHFGRVGTKPQFNIGFQRADGFVEGFEYADLRGWTTPDNTTYLELSFVSRKIKIRGNNLGQVIQLIRQHRLADLIEARRDQAMSLSESDVVVNSLSFV